MPGMNGIDLARRLRQRFPPAQLRLIALSAYAGADIRDACLDAGFDAYLVKPGEIAELEELLGRDCADVLQHDITSAATWPDDVIGFSHDGRLNRAVDHDTRIGTSWIALLPYPSRFHSARSG